MDDNGVEVALKQDGAVTPKGRRLHNQLPAPVRQTPLDAEHPPVRCQLQSA